MLIKKLTVSEEIVDFVHFSPDSRRMVMAGREAIRLWDLDAGTETHRLAYKKPAYYGQPAIFSEDGKVVYAVLEDKGRKLVALDVADLKIQKEISVDPMRDVNSLVFVPRKNLLIAGGCDRVHYFVDTTKNVLVNPPIGHFDEVYSTTFAPDDATLWTTCNSGYVIGWDVKSGMQIHKKKVHEYHAHSIAFVGEDAFLSFSTDKSLALMKWNPKELIVQKKQLTVRFDAIAGPLRNKRMLVASHKLLFEYDCQSGQLVQRDEKFKDFIETIALSPSKNQLAVASDQSVFIYDLASGKGSHCKHDAYVYGIAYSSDGKMLATACRDGTVAIWDTVNGETIRKYAAHRSTATSVVFFGNDRGLISAGYDSRIHFWDLGLNTEKPIRTLENSYRGRISKLSLSHDGTTLAAGEMGGLVTLWDVKKISEEFLGMNRK